MRAGLLTVSSSLACLWCALLAAPLARSIAAAPPPPPPELRAPVDLLVESLAEAAAQGIDAPSPRFSWSLALAAALAAAPAASAGAGARGVAQAAYEVRLSYSRDAAAPPLYTTGRVASPATSLVALPAAAPPLPPSAVLYWSVRAWPAGGGPPSPFSAPAALTTGVGAGGWPGEWVRGARGVENLFRGVFVLPVPRAAVVSALAHVAGLGVHETTFNGASAGQGLLAAARKLDGGWTDYAKRVFYTTHDIGAALVDGENVLGCALGNGWFNDAGWYKRPPYGWPSAANGGGFSFAAAPLLRVNVVLTLANGSVARLWTAADGSGGAAFAGASGPVTFDSLYDGEAYDGRRAAALQGWDAPGFAPAPGDWLPVASASANTSVNPALHAALVAQPFEPTQRLTDAPPLASWEAEPGTTVYDFGANGVGNVRWTFRGLPADANVTLRYAEVLLHPPYGPANSSAYFGNLRNARATDYYYADGSGGVEVYEPHFTWHGFRYAVVSGAPAAPALADVALVRQGNGVAPGAAAVFAAPLLGKLAAMAATTIAASMQGGPGSCGQRDERQFFTGDTAVSAQTVLQHVRARPLLAAWALTGVDAQNADGSIGYYLPTPIGDARDGSPQWSTGFLTVVWQLLRLEGDLATAAATYAAVQRYVAFNEGQYAAAVAKCGGLACYWPAWPSEWQQVGPDPNPSAMNAFAYIRDLQMAGDVAAARGQAAAAAAWRARAAARTAAYHAAFFQPANATYGTGSASELALALALGAPPDAATAAAVFARLLAVVAAAGTKQTPGIVGARFFYDALADYGRADVGLRILLDDTAPSFGYMAQGADNPEPSATLWEIWRADTGDPIMSSRNHLMFVSYASFLLRLCCGVEPRGAGYADGALVWPVGFGLANGSQALLPWAGGSMATPRGTVDVQWTTAAPPAPALPTCALAHEAPAPGWDNVTLSCGGERVAAVAFADFGTPSGECGGAPFAAGSCHTANASAVVAALCLGRANCTIPADIRFWGDPCEGTTKVLAVNLTCTGAPPPPPAGLTFLGALSVTVPVNLPAVVRLPTFGRAAGAVAVTEGPASAPTDPRVWAAGAFVPGVPGVAAAVVTPLAGPPGAVAIDVSVGSGAYVFTVWAAE